MSALDIAIGVAATLTVQSLWSYWRAPRIKVDEEGNWHFPLETLGHMLAIPPERRERFLAELPDALRQIWALKAKYPLATLPGSVWVDDGKGEFRPNVVNAPANAGDVFSDGPLNDGASQ